MEKAVLNVENLNVTQGMNGGFSHQGDLAIDMGTACAYLKAPFTGTIKRIYKNCNAVWLESNEPVKYADGTEDYMTVMTFHDNDVSNLYVGKVINQGEIYYQPGVKGYATGSHIHIGIQKGKFTGSGWYQNSYGTWVGNNQYDITKGLFLYEGVKRMNPMYDWNITNDFGTKEVKYLNLKPNVTKWAVYKTNKHYSRLYPSDILANLNPNKFGGLSYKIHQDMGNYHFKIITDMYGVGYIAGNPNKYDCTITNEPVYECGNF